MGLPRLIRPMTAVLCHELPADEERYGWELKWDGVRAVGYVAEGTVRLLSRNDRDVTGAYPELAVLGDILAEPVIVDGEIVALDTDGRPSFGRLQRRMHVRHPTQGLIRSVPVQYYVFDLLHRGDRALLAQPYVQRRARLEELGLDAAPVRTPPWWRDDAEQVLAVSLDHGLEGVVGKPLRSRYAPGRRGPWIKVKNVRHQEVIVAGWTPGTGRRSATIGSLVLGLYHEHGLGYVGSVGTGFTDAMLHDLTRRLAPLRRDTNPFDTTVPREIERDARWVAPELVAEVAFTDWTPDGHLRHPSWRGLRPGKNPEQIHRELVEPGATCMIVVCRGSAPVCGLWSSPGRPVASGGRRRWRSPVRVRGWCWPRVARRRCGRPWRRAVRTARRPTW